MVGRGVWGMRAPVSLTVGVLAVGLSACGSMVAMEREAPDGPRISRLEFLTTVAPTDERDLVARLAVVGR